MDRQLVMEEVRASYQGQRHKTVRLFIAGKSFDLGLSGTARALDLPAAEETLASLFERAGARPPAPIEELAIELQAKCRELTKWEPPKPKQRGLKKRAGWHWKTL